MDDKQRSRLESLLMEALSLADALDEHVVAAFIAASVDQLRTEQK
ncbi:hypothetical protein [Sphingomonas sp. Leaf339]|nr:hypothetical protein [Sphingomonas sp. Leaf339]